MNAATSAAAVANEFIDLDAAEKGMWPALDPMKMQKLLFYSHAWHLAMKDSPLFEEDVEAWPWGPVIRDIYVAFKDCGRGAINKKATKLELSANDASRLRAVEPRIDSPETKEFVKSVWETLKKHSGIFLSNATHMPGEPWTLVKDEKGSLDLKPSIPNDLIKQVFKAKLVK